MTTQLELHTSLPSLIDAPTAAHLARRAKVGSMGRPQQVFHRMTGIEFVLRGNSGAAKKLSGQRLCVLADRVSGAVMTCDAWPELPTAEELPTNAWQPAALQFSIDEMVARARTTVAPVIMKKIKLMSSFELEAARIIDPLWKPNWLLEAHTPEGPARILVDGLDGALAVQRG